MAAARTTPELDRLLVGPTFQADPYPAYRHLRAEAPVHWSDAWGMWVLSRYADVAATLRDPRRYTKVGHVTQRLDDLPDDVLARVQPLYRNFSVGMAVTDPPSHTRIRTLVNKSFTPRIVHSLRERVGAIVDELIDSLTEVAEFDFVRDFAYPLPAIVVFELLGFPTEARDQYKAWSDAIVAFHGTDRPDPLVVERSNAAYEAAREWILEQAEQRRTAPRLDLLSELVAAEDAGHVLSQDELVATIVTLGTAGHETTTGLLANGIRALSAAPDQRRRLRDDPSTVERAVEEMLRYDPPFHRTWRVTTETVSLGGLEIEAGSIVTQLLAAANRDPDVFDEPDTFDISRSKGRHVAFGLGTHFCLGAPLARLETQLAIPRLLLRLGDLDVDQGRISWAPGNTFRLPEAMPVRVVRASGSPFAVRELTSPPKVAATTLAGHRLVDVAARDDIKPGELLLVNAEGRPIVIVDLDGRLNAVSGTCTHDAWSLEDGFLFEGSLTCSLHGSRFDVMTGEVLDPPAEDDLAVYTVHVENGRVSVLLPIEGEPLPSDDDRISERGAL